jgi:hypothetical protein
MHNPIIKIIAELILNTVLDWREWSASRSLCFIFEEAAPQYPFYGQPGWTPEPVWTTWRRVETIAPAENRSLFRPFRNLD